MALTEQDQQYLTKLVSQAKSKVKESCGLEVTREIKFDMEKTLEENKALVIQTFRKEKEDFLKKNPTLQITEKTPVKSTTSKEKKEQEELEKAKKEKEELEKKQKEEKEIIQKWKQQFNPNMIIKSPAYYKMEKYIEMVCSGHINFCVIQSDGGLAKTWSSNSILKKKSQKYATYNSFTSPLEFYNFLYDHAENYDILIDDCEGIWDNKAIVSLLKNATELDGNRVISWNSTTSKLEGRNTKANFNSRIILLTNVLPNSEKNNHIKALLSRALVEKLNFSYEEKLDVIREVSKREYKGLSETERKEVFEFLERNTSPATSDLSIRTLIKLYKFYLFGKDSNNMELFKTLGLDILKAPKHRELVFEMVKKAEKPVKEQVDDYVALTGRSRADYYRIKDELFPKEHPYQRVVVNETKSN